MLLANAVTYLYRSEFQFHSPDLPATFLIPEEIQVEEKNESSKFWKFEIFKCNRGFQKANSAPYDAFIIQLVLNETVEIYVLQKFEVQDRPVNFRPIYRYLTSLPQPKPY